MFAKLFSCLLIFCLSGWAHSQTPINFSTEPFDAETVFTETFKVEGASWIRLFFGDLNLEGATLSITSLKDGARQDFHGGTMKQWQGTSAYMNGNAATVEIQTVEKGAYFTLKHILSDLDMDNSPNYCKYSNDTLMQKSECFSPDRRVLSNDKRVARYMYGGPGTNGCCTAWTIDDPHHCYLSAAHCTDSGFSVVQYEVPLSQPDGTLNHPPPEHQYVVDQASNQRGSSGSNDWRYFGVFRNTQTGLTPFERYGAFYRLATTTSQLPPIGSSIRITGYGEQRTVNCRYRRVQATAAESSATGGGLVTSSMTNMIRYRTDDSNGNSGSPIESEANGFAIGIQTLGGCRVGNPNSSNAGPGILVSALQNALRNPRGVCLTGPM